MRGLEQHPIRLLIGCYSTSLFERADSTDLTIPRDRHLLYYGEGLERHALVRAGEQMFIPPDVPHAPCNESGKACTWLVVHSSGSDQDGIALLPELDAVLAKRVG